MAVLLCTLELSLAPTILYINKFTLVNSNLTGNHFLVTQTQYLNYTQLQIH